MRKLLWTPSEQYRTQSNMYQFMLYVNDKYTLFLHDYRTLYEWSVMRPQDFWGTLWEFLDIITSSPYETVADDLERFPGVKWFVGAKLNYAENILRWTDSEEEALIFRGEQSERRSLSWRELERQVQALAQRLRQLGLRPGDAVAAYLPNMPETIIAMLASAAIGAVWCSCATDIGPQAAVDRLGQVQPKVLISVDGYLYKGHVFPVLEHARQVAESIPSLEKVILVHYAGESSERSQMPNSLLWEEAIATPTKDFYYEQVDANSPLVVMFSSGTTGKPKCMAQSVGGLLINQLKELALQNDVKKSDRMLYITSCSWMMWNWQLAALGCGCSLVLFDGNPAYPDEGAIWRILEEERVTIFGLSASYIHMLMAHNFSPRQAADLSALRLISQTGSALSEEGFDFIYREIKKDLHFNSIAGGTDINGCFSSGNPLSPVYSGELQSPGLGMKIECFDEKGHPVRDEQGQLVCILPCPPMPLYFINDPDNKRYLDAYFRVYPHTWYHGDYVVIHSDTLGISYYGRSDSVLKPSGVRIGTSEIYNQVEKLPEVIDSLAIGQNYHDDQRIILFVQLKPGLTLDEELCKRIKKILRENASPRHVPALIFQTQAIPATLNGKKVESAVANIFNGRPVTNRQALSNPESLDFYEELAQSLKE